MNRNRSPMMLCLVVALVSGSCVELHAQPVGSTGEPKKTTVSVAITNLRREALESWHRNGDWPRAEADFAAAKHWAVPSEQVITALGRRLHRNPAIDGYIKWQLLSFDPDMSLLADNQIRRMGSMMPVPLEPPKPEPQPTRGGTTFMMFGRQTNYVADLDPALGDGVALQNPKMGTISSGVGLGSNPSRGERMQYHAQLAHQINRKLQRSRAALGHVNGPVLAYRSAMIDRLSGNNPAIRLGLMLREIRTMLEAGHERCGELLDQTLALAERHSTELDARRRAVLVEWAAALATLGKPIVDAAYVDRQGELQYQTHLLRLDAAKVKTLVGYLQIPPK